MPIFDATQLSMSPANMESAALTPRGISPTILGPPTSSSKYVERLSNSATLTLLIRNMACGIGVVVTEQAAVDEARDEEILDKVALDMALEDVALDDAAPDNLALDMVSLDMVALDMVALDMVAPGKVPVFSSSSGSASSGLGCDSSGIGLPKSPTTNRGKPHDGGSMNSVPHPKRDLNKDRSPDPHPFLLGSLPVPPSPVTIRP